MNCNLSVDESARCTDRELHSPEFEFRQPPDERAELLILLGRKGWSLICRRDFRVVYKLIKVGNLQS